ncbi:MAG: co-chaperone GroES [Methanogenium sp.]|jgi:chaperonin GroES
MKQFNPIGDKILVKVSKKETKTDAGLLIPDATLDSQTHSNGVIVAVGTGEQFENGQRQVFDVKPGDEVYFAQYAGVEIKLDDEAFAYYLVKQSDIHGIFSE